MDSYVKAAVEALIRKLRTDATPRVVLVPQNDYFEIKKVPSLLLVGPTLQENLSKRTAERFVERDLEALTYTERDWPRFYHLDFDLVLTTADGPELLDLQEKVVAFFLSNRELAVGEGRSYWLRELTPVGGLQRPNLSDLRQTSGRYRIEDVEVFGGEVEEGKLVLYRDVVVRDKASGQEIEVFHLDE